LLLLLLIASRSRRQWRAFLFVGSCGAGGGDGCSLFFEGLALQGLKFGEGLFEFTKELALLVFLSGLET